MARRPKISRVAGAALIRSLLLAACGGASKKLAVSAACKTIAGTSSSAIALPGSWPDPNGDLANTRDATSSTISKANVSRLKQAWSFKLTGRAAAKKVQAYGSLTAKPIVQAASSTSRTSTPTCTRSRWDRQARVGVPLRSAREERTGTQRRSGRDGGCTGSRRPRPSR